MLNNIDTSTYDIAKKLCLANTSGIGYGSFNTGGMIVDLGYPLRPEQKPFVEHSYDPPKLVMNYPVPTTWRVIVVIPNNIQSLSGKLEDNFYERITPVDMKEVYEICYNIFMGILPSLTEEHFDNFLFYLSRMSELGTKRFELEINETITNDILKLLKKEFGFAGMSSLGPACYSFYDATKRNVNLKHLSEVFPDCQLFDTKVRSEGFRYYE